MCTSLLLVERASLLVLSLFLASCASPPRSVSTSGTETDKAAATPTPAAYRDLFPLAPQPEGRWKTYRNETLGLAFEYPVVYDELDCGQLLLFEKEYDGAACTVVGFGSIRLRVCEDWTGDAAERAAVVQTVPEIQVLTAVEPFLIDGEPAFRVAFTLPRQADLVYVKSAVTACGGKLYDFSYNRTLLSYLQCDAPPISQEAVYEHLLSTFEFVD